MIDAPDLTAPAAPVVEKTTTQETVVSSGPNPPLPTHDEKTRRIIVWLLFAQFNFFVAVTMSAMLFKGWELSPASTNVIMIILTGEVGFIGTAVGFYLGATSAVKVAKP
jgi:hypothetical protein